eukprot:symbB.v1.2.003562.t1/scaffold204.1/size273638/11
MRRHVVRTKKRRQANEDSEDAPESWSFVQFVALFVCITGLLCMVFQLRLVASDRGPQLRQDFGQAFRHRLKIGASELGAYQERRESIAPTREDVGRVPSNDDLVRQLAEIDKVQRQAAGALSPWRAGRQQAPQRSETSIESTQRISVETKPSTSHGASDKTRSCEWDRHVGQYLGEYLNSGQEVDLLDAQEKCISAGAAASGTFSHAEA